MNQIWYNRHMNRIRCKDCGMSVVVKNGETMVKCPICGARTFVATAEKVSSLDDYYNTDDYHADSASHAREHVFVDRVEEEKRRRNRRESHLKMHSENQNASKMVLFVVVVLFFILFFLLNFLL